MRYIIDIDGTICTKSEDSTYLDSNPLKDRIDYINSLYDQDHTIIYYTARGMHRYDGDSSQAFKKFFPLTNTQLKKWGCKYHELRFGKPAGDIYVDDKGINADDFFKG
jgi:hypothetical protein